MKTKNKKYRLRKWYPSLPKDWEVGMEVGYGDKGCGKVAPCNAKYTQKWIDDIQVRNNPEFWEEVVEKDYEILSIKVSPFYTGTCIREWTPKDTKGFPLKTMLHRGACVDSGDFYIHSIKRLSDGEVFTVGDKIESVKEYSFDTTNTIKRFIVDNKGHLFVILDNCNESTYSTKGSFNCFKHVKPIFTTEDGVDMYEGDEYWIVFHKTFNLQQETKACSGCGKRKDATYFSTKEKAEEWIEDNKPQYSKAQIRTSMIEWLNSKSRLNRIDMGTGKQMSLKLTDEFIEELKNDSD